MRSTLVVRWLITLPVKRRHYRRKPNAPALPTCAYEVQCRAQCPLAALGLPMADRCSLLRKADVKEWQIRDCQKAQGFTPCT